jgi:hypothetical protein
MQTKFELDDLEIEKAKKFENKHIECVKKCPSTIGGYIDYIFTPTSVGTAISMKCYLCGEEENITNYDKW